MSEFVTKVVVEGDNRTGPALAAASKGVENYSKAVQRGNASLRATTRQSRATFTQLGYQAQDVAVQLQAGQSPFMVLSQQGSQIASIFGPGGAVFGAFLAIGGAIAGSLLPNLFGAKNSMQDVIDKSKELNESLTTMTKAQRAHQIRSYTTQIEELKQKNIDLKEEIDDVNSSIYARLKGDKYLADEETRLRAEIDNNIQSMDNLQLALDIVNGKTSEGTKNTREQTAAIEEWRRKTEESIATVGMSTDQLEIYQLAQMAATNEDFARLHTLIMLRNEMKEMEDADKKAAEDAKDRAAKAKKEADAIAQKARAYEQLKRSLDPAYSATQAYKDAIVQIQASSATQEEKIRYIAIAYAKYYEALNPVNDKLKELTKTESTSQSAVDSYIDTVSDLASIVDNTAVSALKNMEDQFVNLINGTTNVKDAFSNMAKSIIDDLIRIQIQQTITKPLAGLLQQGIGAAVGYMTGSPYLADGGGMPTADGNDWGNFAGGGYTGSGTRTGGVDGKGGFPAILHPNETVVDHTQGDSGSGVTIVQNINIQTGVQQTVRAEIKNLLPQITAATKSAVADSRQRGGGFSKALVGA